ncbi:HDOD domain-containing protein, partial [Pseudomonas syringae group genomosp. 7]|uniref:HDOD domain-containing protein n=1 Tax=Pseudomonas syringae group genomosp. 7 TaxID=251699 RepID=UPI0037706FDD
QPIILLDLQMELFFPVPDLGAIARMISQDPGLSGALLKIVNSAHYGLSNKIASIEKAGSLLGRRTVFNLIKEQSIRGE